MPLSSVLAMAAEGLETQCYTDSSLAIVLLKDKTSLSPWVPRSNSLIDNHNNNYNNNNYYYLIVSPFPVILTPCFSKIKYFPGDGEENVPTTAQRVTATCQQENKIKELVVTQKTVYVVFVVAVVILLQNFLKRVLNT